MSVTRVIADPILSFHQAASPIGKTDSGGKGRIGKIIYFGGNVVGEGQE
ncbi:MAG: hypothetical protein M1526_03410 [Candidatus Thermoplasmatota archaeon]|jgi:hypothetical protein|nr:hypothetical protein [Candidatus Thermoplasmatota archaeon]MCL5681151.1 hypothetical protein [Candidatus Thermoplasmatota archaeon]